MEVEDQSEDDSDDTHGSDAQMKDDDSNDSPKNKSFQSGGNNSDSEIFRKTPEKSYLQEIKRRRSLHGDSHEKPFQQFVAVGSSPTHHTTEEKLFDECSAPNKMSHKSVSTSRLLAFCTFLLFVLFCWLCFCDNGGEQKCHNNQLDEFKSDFVSLKRDFANQSKRFWKILESATKSIIYKDSPSDPAVILLVASDKNLEKTVNCFIDNYVNLVIKFFNQSRNDVVRFDFIYSTDDPPALKMDIDKKLKHSFSSGSHVAVFEHLEWLAGEAAMMFHGYCDNDNAPFKRVIMLMTIYLQDIKSRNDKNTKVELDVDRINQEKDDYVEQLMQVLWADEIGEETIASLMSRIGNYKIFLKKEQDVKLSALKC
ncbi:hypothetical protein HELRODRAFT_175770 [Helobdella robusta]|uniref:Torsin-1A-interacting protein 1/2 AAA+ activator domain-containing protein n=1 Tax=Helobdella robusta TaxID=6412 RepID=T1F9M8_HELRO|nr:hypothetical protein HELRODRAFT_175770 [Helobdella robusta]ESO00360.1 hypothetical protein HELRODRAFT_175770 [Helobdella robusta]